MILREMMWLRRTLGRNSDRESVLSEAADLDPVPEIGKVLPLRDAPDENSNKDDRDPN